MHILYLDESGSPNSWQVQRNFVIGGVAIHEGQIYSLSRALNAIQEKYFPGITVPIEFHVTPIRKGSGPYFNQFNRETRQNIIDDIYNIINRTYFPNLIAFATCIDVSAITHPNQECYDCFKDVSQNFNLFLYHQYTKGIPAKGMLIIDRGRERQYLEIYSEFKRSEEVTEYLGNIIDIPYFAACRETRMLQLADFVANAVFRYYESDIPDDMDIIMPRFYKGPRYHPISGLNHITAEAECQCYACH